MTPDVGQLYKQYGAMVYRRALRFFGPEEAEDVVHEIFIQVMRRVDGFRGDSSPSTWLYRVATNHCLKRLSKQSRRQELWSENEMDMRAPSVSSANQEAAALLNQLWAKLPEEMAAIGIYRYGDGMTLEEIARVTGLSRKTVHKRLGELDKKLELATRG